MPLDSRFCWAGACHRPADVKRVVNYTDDGPETVSLCTGHAAAWDAQVEAELRRMQVKAVEGIVRPSKKAAS